MKKLRLNSIRSPQSARGAERRGASTVELAIVSPVMFAIFFAAVEFGRANQVLNATSNAAYQGCRAAIIPGGTSSVATTAAQNYLSASLISGATITVNPSTITNTTTVITVTVSVPMNQNSWIGQSFMAGKTVTRACTLTREKTN